LRRHIAWLYRYIAWLYRDIACLYRPASLSVCMIGGHTRKGIPVRPYRGDARAYASYSYRAYRAYRTYRTYRTYLHTTPRGIHVYRWLHQRWTPEAPPYMNTTPSVPALPCKLVCQQARACNRKREEEGVCRECVKKNVSVNVCEYVWWREWTLCTTCDTLHHMSLSGHQMCMTKQGA